MGRHAVPPTAIRGSDGSDGGGCVHRGAHDGFPYYATCLFTTFSAFSWTRLQAEYGWHRNLAEAPAHLGAQFTYWFITRGLNEEQKWEVDRKLKLLPEEEVQEHDVNVVEMAGGEIG